MRSGSFALALIVAILAGVPFIVSDYAIGLLDTAGIYAIVAVGLSVLGGIGQFSLGHAGFYAIGAFTAGVLAAHYGWPFWLDVPTAGLVAAIAGLAVGVPTLRLRGPYLSIATLSFGLLVQESLSTAAWAGGRTGITLRPPTIGSYALTDRSFFWIVAGVLVVAVLVAHNLRHGAIGRAFRAMRVSVPAARASGINTAGYRVAAFAVSALYAGIAGALYAHWAGYISVASFGLSLSISFVAMIVVGGVDSPTGAVLGAVVLSLLAQLLQGQSHVADALYGAIIVAIVLFLPGGLVGLLRFGRRWHRWPGRAVPMEEPRV